MLIKPLIQNLQDIDTPDFDLDRDLIGPEQEEVILGMKTGKISSKKKYSINLATILVSALAFIAILAWFDFIQTTFYNFILPPDKQDPVASQARLWYALFISIIIFILVYLIYYHSRSTVMFGDGDDDHRKK